MPPTNESPAPVGSTTLGSGYAGQMNRPLRPGQDRAVRAFLDDDVLRAELVNLLQRGEHVVLLGQLLRLAVVEHEAINALEQLQQVRQRDVEPQVHRVGHDELGPPHLVEHMMLQRRARCWPAARTAWS